MKSKFLRRITTFAMASMLLMGSTLGVDAAGSGYNGSGYNGSGYQPNGNESGGNNSAIPSVMSDTVKSADGKTLYTSVPGRYTAKKVPGTIVSSPASYVTAALGLVAGETAYMKISDSLCGPQAKKCVEDITAMMGIKVGPMLDVFMGKINLAGKYEEIDNTLVPVEFKVGVPNGFKPAAGYELAILRVQKGGAVTLLPNLNEDPNIITFMTDGSGVFVFVQVPAGSLDGLK